MWLPQRRWHPAIHDLRGDHVQRLAFCRRDDHEVAGTLRGGECTGNALRLGCGWPVVDAAYAEHHVADPDHRTLHRVLDPGRCGAEHRAGCNRPAQRDGAFQPVDPARELSPGQPPRHPGDQGVGHAHAASGGGEGGLQHIGAGHIPSRDRVVIDRPQLDATAVRSIHNRGEGGRGWQGWRRKPVDGTVERDERDRATVADRRVCAQVCVAVNTVGWSFAGPLQRESGHAPK